MLVLKVEYLFCVVGVNIYFLIDFKKVKKLIKSVYILCYVGVLNVILLNY